MCETCENEGCSECANEYFYFHHGELIRLCSKCSEIFGYYRIPDGWQVIRDYHYEALNKAADDLHKIKIALGLLKA